MYAYIFQTSRWSHTTNLLPLIRGKMILKEPQLEAAITYHPHLPSHPFFFLHRMCTDNRHLNCHGKQPRRQPTTRTRRKACRWSKSGWECGRWLDGFGGGSSENVCSFGCAFCAKWGKKILQPDGAVANIFTPCCHMLNEQNGKMKDKNGGGQAENQRRMPRCLAIVIFVKLTRCQLLPDVWHGVLFRLLQEVVKWRRHKFN